MASVPPQWWSANRVRHALPPHTGFSTMIGTCCFFVLFGAPFRRRLSTSAPTAAPRAELLYRLLQHGLLLDDESSFSWAYVGAYSVLRRTVLAPSPFRPMPRS